MKANSELFGGVIYSQRVMLELINKGLSREEAYKLAQENAHKAWNTLGGNFKENLLNDDRVKDHLNESEIQDCFDPNII